MYGFSTDFNLSPEEYEELSEAILWELEADSYKFSNPQKLFALLQISPENSLGKLAEVFAAIRHDSFGEKSLADLILNEFKRTERHQTSFCLELKELNKQIEVKICVRLNELSGQRRVYGSLKDISEKASHLRALNEESKHFLKVQSAAQIGTWRYLVEPKQIIWSQETFKIFSRAVSLGEPSFEEHKKTILPEDLELWETTVETALQEGKPYEMVYRIVTPEGTIKYLQALGEAIRENGEVKEIFGLVMDITKAEESRLQLKASEERFSLAVNATKDGIWDWVDISKNDNYWSPRYKELLGYAPDEIEANYSNFLQLLHPQDFTRVKAAVDEHLKGNSPYDIEYRLKAKSGEYKWFRAKGEMTWNSHTNSMRMAGSLTDISDFKAAEARLRESEEKFKQAFEKSPIGMALVALDGKFFNVNEMICQIVGYKPEELIGKTFMEITHPDDCEPDLAMLNKLIKDEIKSYQIEKRYIHKDGHMIWILLNATLVRDIDGKPLYGIAQIQDITKRKEDELKLREVQERLDLAVQGASVGLWDWDLKTNTLFWSTRYKEILGLPIVESESNSHLNAQSFFSLLHPDDREKVEASVNAHLATGCAHDMDFRMLKADGSYIWIHGKGRAILGENGKPIRMAGTVEDVTSRKEVERNNIERERRFRAIFDGTFQFTGLMLPDGTLIEANKAALDFGGLTEKDVVNKPFWTTYWFSGSEETPKQIKKSIQRAAAGEFVRHEVSIIGAGGVGAIIDFSIKPIMDEEGKVTLMIPEGRNITELKKAEEALRKQALIFENILDSVILTDLAGNVSDLNKAAENMFGYSKAEMLGQNLDEILKTQGEDFSLESILEEVKKGHKWSGEVSIIHKDGRLKTCEKVILPIKNHNDQTVAIVSVCHDITERKEFEEQLKYAKEQAEAGNVAKSSFIATISHELRTPLNGVIGMSQLLKHTSLNEEQEEYVRIIKMSSETLLNLINNILDFSKIESGKLELDMSEFNLKSCVEDVFALTFQQAAEKAIDLFFYIDPQTPSRLIGDSMRLRQTLMNLVSNALKFTHLRGDITISIKPLRRSSDNSTLLLFSVKDTGIGIAPEKISKLFQPFSQADSSTTRKYGGSGLGLTICKKLVEQMNGEIWVESTEGQGSNFLFTAEFGYLKSQSVAEEKAQEANTNSKILLLSSKSSMQEYFEDFCHEYNLHLDSAYSEAEAVNYLHSNHKYSLIVLDSEFNNLNADLQKALEESQAHLLHLGFTISTKANYPAELFLKPIKRKRLAEKLHQLNGQATKSDLKVLIVDENPISQQIAVKLLHQIGCMVDLTEKLNQKVEQDYDLVLLSARVREQQSNFKYLTGSSAKFAILKHPDEPIIPHIEMLENLPDFLGCIAKPLSQGSLEEILRRI